MKSALNKVVASILALSFALPASIALYPPHQANAQAGAGKASACAAGLLTAIGVSAPAWLKEVVGVSDGSGDTGQDIANSAATNAVSFNSCILQPLAKTMIVALIRNIGSSVVNWVNTGFQGSPTFVTDFAGTVLDAADQAVGTFIEGTELGFLCNDFGFQVRIALALKYSQPFRERARCTATDIAQNVLTNGGTGWENWLAITTEPQNNVYGAYVIAESELAERAARAAGIKEKRIALAEGFLDFETCDEWETPADISSRLRSVAAPEGSLTIGSDGSSSFSPSAGSLSLYNQDPSTFGGSLNVFNQPNIGANLGGPTFGVPGQSSQPDLSFNNYIAQNTVQTSLAASVSTKPQCKKSSTKTPGTIISSKLKGVLGQSEIQAAVAQEIDDVIAATMNQLAQKVIMGAQGLLGMSRKSGTTQSYYNRYQNQFYGVPYGTAAGATSPAEDYQVGSYDDAAALIQADAQVQNIYRATDIAAASAVAEQQAQQDAIHSTYGNEASNQQNFALLKPTSESSYGGGSANNAVNGITDGNVSQYNQPAITGEEESPWWEVDLGSPKQIKEVRIWRVTNKPASETLGTIRVIASDGAGQGIWTSQPVTPSDSGPNPTVVAVNQTKRYVRIEKQSELDEQCRVLYEFRGETEYESCYHPLELAEVEVMGTVSFGTTTSSSSGSSSGSSQGPAQDDGRAATSTLAWETASPASVVASSGYELRLTAEKPVSVGNELSVRTSLKRNGVQVAYLSVFSSFDFMFGREGEQISTFSIAPSNDSGAFELSRVTIGDPSKYYSFKQKAQGVKAGALPGSYTIETTVSDKFGTILQTATGEFVVQ